MTIWILVISWVVLALVVLGMAIYRNLLGMHENAVHVSPTAGTTEVKNFKKAEHIERWGQWLTVAMVAYGLVVATVYLLQLVETGPAR
jgi:hypothetical protein